jgi:adenosylcobyric acid synthase
VSGDGQVAGSYVHGLFESPPALDALLRWAGLVAPETIDYAALREQALERLADACEQHLDLRPVRRLLGLAETEAAT